MSKGNLSGVYHSLLPQQPWYKYIYIYIYMHTCGVIKQYALDFGSHVWTSYKYRTWYILHTSV